MASQCFGQISLRASIKQEQYIHKNILMNNASAQIHLTQPTKIKNTWLADLFLEFSSTPHGTQLSKTKRSGPLSVQKAFYPEGRDCAHIYLLHPPAGIVSGDELHISAMVQAKAHALLTTPGANRFYRAREDLSIGITKQEQITHCYVANYGKLENFPQETIVYNGADGFNTVDLHLHKNSVYLGWDITSMGLPSSQQHFTTGQYTQLNRLFIDNQLTYHDRITISANNQLLHHPAGLAGHHVFATFLAYASEDVVAKETRKALVETMREQLLDLKANHLISITDIKGILVIRYLGLQAEQCKSLFISLWQTLRPIYLNKSGVMPRIWHT